MENLNKIQLVTRTDPGGGEGRNINRPHINVIECFEFLKQQIIISSFSIIIIQVYISLLIITFLTLHKY